MRLTYIIMVASVAFSCSKDTRRDISKLNNNGADKASTAKERISRIDSIFSLRKGIILFSKRLNSDSVEQVYKDEWPDNTGIAYNVCMDDSVVVLLKEIPQIESGDFSIIYSYYFSSEGKTFATKSEVSFFNNDCSDGAIKETRTSYYGDNSEPYMINYVLQNKHNVRLDSLKCGFGQLPNFNLYKKISETPIYPKLR
jgi:hypothetical protein